MGTLDGLRCHALWRRLCDLSIYAQKRVSGRKNATCFHVLLLFSSSSVPSGYVHALECFVAAKQEFLSEDASTSTDSHSSNLSTMYDYQRKYVNALLKQLPPGTLYPAASRSFLMHPPGTIKNLPARQGPYLLQPSPLVLDGSDGGDATDIIQMAFGAAEDDDGDAETERLGVVLIAYQDGRVDVCLDVEKVEARWDIKQVRCLSLGKFAAHSPSGPRQRVTDACCLRDD